jgi:hypothetical protein
VGTLIAIVLGLNLTNQGWTAVADALNLGIDPAWRVLAVAAGLSAIVGAIFGAVVGAWRRGGRGFIDGLVVGTLLGAAIGAFTAIAFGPQVGAAFGVLFGLLTMAALIALDISRREIDTEALKARFYPAQTIETTKETIEWLQEQSPLGRS